MLLSMGKFRSIVFSRENSVNSSFMIGRFSFLYLGCVDARKCYTIHFRHFAIVHVCIQITALVKMRLKCLQISGNVQLLDIITTVRLRLCN